ncbi:MAG: 4-hydroxythreonine-4-phosphate dehydrogenase PdxA, partial [Candidatus Latescibacterota bacterium]
AVEELKAAGINVNGPISPDTVFPRGMSGEFDGIVAMFHDQGHIALKIAGFKLGDGKRQVEGVNTTLGLPIIRTSVDHGTAFDIAGKGIASPLSMLDALELAALMAKNRIREL